MKSSGLVGSVHGGRGAGGGREFRWGGGGCWRVGALGCVSGWIGEVALGWGEGATYLVMEVMDERLCLFGRNMWTSVWRVKCRVRG